MKNFKLTIDGKSFLLGLLTCTCFLFFSAFNTSHDFQTGRYQVVSTPDKDVIIDTETGTFVISSYNARTKLYKYKFEDIEETPSRDFKVR